MLQRSNYGDKLLKSFVKIVELYQNQAECICFLGEGKNTVYEHNEFCKMINTAKKYGLKTCLYCGRDTGIEKWMKNFDYLKIGSYREDLGGLNCKTTNQRLFEKKENEHIDITYKFWK